MTVDDDPGADLHQWYGRFHYFAPDEVVPLDGRPMSRILVAGIGNVFLGDDAFGVEVVRRLDPSTLPTGVDVVDYGIRGVHLAYDLLDGRHHTVVLVDAVPLDDPPGTLAVLDVDPTGGGMPVDAHGMHPAAVLALLHDLGGTVDRVLVVGCAPRSSRSGWGSRSRWRRPSTRRCGWSRRSCATRCGAEWQ